MQNHCGVECPCCRRLTAEEWGARPDRAKLFRCRRCGLIFRRGSAWSGDAYGETYYAQDPLSKERGTVRVRIIQHFLGGQVKQKLRLLDVGCGQGHFMRVIQDLGWELVGIDISSWAVRKAQELGLRVFHGAIEASDIFMEDEERFDIVTAWDSRFLRP